MNQQEAAISSRVAGQTVGQFIRGQRLKLGLTQEALAEAIGASTRSIRRWELDQAIPHEVVRNRLCTVFGIERDSLFGAWSIEQASLPSLPFWHVPLPRNPFFTGRAELLHALHVRLKSEQRMALTQSWAISGLGGIGKTQSALEYVYQHAQDYSAVFWISAATQESLQAGLVTVAECLGLPEKDGRDQQRIIGAVKQWLATHQDWLLVLDNADDVTLVQNVLPTQRSGCVLLTTRAQALGPFAQRIDVETMGMAEGTLFLLRRARLLAPDASLDCASLDYLTAAEAIVIEMDFLPLALDQAGAYIEEVGCSLVSYLDLYRTHRTELLSRRGQMPGDYPDSVATTWSLNFQQVEQANSVATQLLRLCAFLSPDAIPEELLNEGSAVLGPVLGQIAINTLTLNGAMEQLRKFSLVQRDPEAQLLRLHRLVQVVLKDAMSREEQSHWAERAVRMTRKVFPDIDDKDAWSRDRRLLSQAQVCSVLIQEYALVFEEAAVLLQRTADYLFHSVLYEQAEHLYQQALHIWEQIRTQHPEAARSFSGLASIYQMQRKYEQAEALYQRALRIREQTQGPDHPEVAGPLRDLGFLSTRQGKYERAEALYQRALRIREQAYGPEHPSVAQMLNNLATLFHSQEKYEQAEPLYHRVIYLREQTSGPESSVVAISLNNLAALYGAQGKYEQAETLGWRALRIWEKVQSPGHPTIAFALDTLSGIFIRQRKYEQARPLCQQARSIWEQALGPEHPSVAAILHKQAEISWKQGEDEQAELLYQRALSIREQGLGEHNLETAETLHDFAAFRQAQGKHQEAATLYQRALAIREQALGANHPTTATTRRAYAALVQGMN